jgi:adenosylhomocysteine nucleosidase
MSRVAIIAAMPGELKPFLNANAKDDWAHERRGNVHLWRLTWPDGQEWVAACGGAGVNAATKAFAEVEKDGAVDLVISTGWAGALGDEFATGRAFHVGEVVDARTGERFEVSAFPPLRQELQDAGSSTPLGFAQNDRRMGHPDGVVDYDPRSPSARDRGHPASLDGSRKGETKGVLLVTSPVVAGEREKQRLAAAYGAGLVDMEAAGVARLAAMRGIPFYCVKGVSDGFRDRLPDFNRFIGPGGEFRLAGFVLYALLRPWNWPALMRMGENSRKAAGEIAELLCVILNERGIISKSDGYPDLKL